MLVVWLEEKKLNAHPMNPVPFLKLRQHPPMVALKTAPADIRFPSTNQTRHCFARYVEYHRCIREKGDEAPECEKFARYYRSLCPSEWIDKWNEQRELGTFAGPL
ncbi:PREDICTED: cytochrome c oxidase subunit 6b-3-like [Nelumbo nucifera]|uniref:Cytochrome c oxidase subunit 6b-3-like n=1 Tax=Nelumbo nucifera TaxID=4432 RepID=A0A1U8B1T0_NELNU|nr:PREDICTED: cytochrome c oxidase subunit 6b-3-like [Nelumbo nucifera]